MYVVVDDYSIRRALKRLLGSVGYHARTFESSAEDFLELAPDPGEGCLVLDIHLPKMTGLDLHEKLVSKGAKFAVIFMTAFDNPRWQKRAKKVGAVAYLKKPFKGQTLLDAIDQCRLRRKGLSRSDGAVDQASC